MRPVIIFNGAVSISSYLLLILVSFIPYDTLALVLLTWNMLVYTYFFAIECVQLRFHGPSKYFSDYWNFVELSNFLGFQGFFVNFVNTKPLPLVRDLVFIKLQWFEIFSEFLKMLYFVKTIPNIGIFVIMQSSAFYNSLSFLSFFVIWMLLFLVLFYALEIHINNDDEEYFDQPEAHPQVSTVYLPKFHR